MVLLEGEILSGLFFYGFCLIDNCLMVVSVYYADTCISKQAGCSSKIMRNSSKRDDAVNIMERYSDRMWQTLLPYESNFLLIFKVNSLRKEKCPEKLTKHVFLLFGWSLD